MTTEKERLLAVLAGRPVDRPPVVMPGGMMNAAVVEVMETAGYGWPDAHTNPGLMAKLAVATRELTDIENVGLPFCMTIEAEALGGGVDYGSASVEPHMTVYADEIKSAAVEAFDPEKTGRMPVVLDAITALKPAINDTPIIGNVVGPMSLVASVLDPLSVYRMVRKDPEGLNSLLDVALSCCVSFAVGQTERGADVIAIADPSATGDILGKAAFREFVAPSLRELVASIKHAGAKTIVHICGDITPVLPEIASIGANAVSFDSGVNISTVRDALADIPLMGNISTLLLHKGSPREITAAVKYVLAARIDILAPACGLSTRTPLSNILAMTRAAKEKSFE
ncbi:MAG: MtaA/CmuA family methyltransferase [Actinomycetota bacterium]